MKTKHTKKQIQESIKHWKKVLESMNEVERNVDKQPYGSIYDINGHNKIIREALNEDDIDDKKVVVDIEEEEMPEGDPSWWLGQQYHLRIEFNEAPLKRDYGMQYHPTPAGYWHVEGKRSDIIRLIRDEFTYGMDRSEREEFARESLSDKDFKKLFPSDDSLEKAFKEEEKPNSVNERDGERDEFGFLPDETDVWLFDFFDGTGRCRNGNYEKYAFASTSATTEQDVKRVLKRMTDSWSKRSLRDAKKEAKKHGETLRSWELPWYSFRADNIEHLSKDEYIKRNFKAVRFFDFNDNMENEVNNKMKYTKKQIEESIKHWRKVLERMNESNDSVPVSIAHWTEIDPNPIDPNSPLFGDSKNVRTSNSSQSLSNVLGDFEYAIVINHGDSYTAISLDDLKEFPQWWNRYDDYLININKLMKAAYPSKKNALGQ